MEVRVLSWAHNQNTPLGGILIVLPEGGLEPERPPFLRRLLADYKNGMSRPSLRGRGESVYPLEDFQISFIFHLYKSTLIYRIVRSVAERMWVVLRRKGASYEHVSGSGKRRCVVVARSLGCYSLRNGMAQQPVIMGSGENPECACARDLYIGDNFICCVYCLVRY